MKRPQGQERVENKIVLAFRRRASTRSNGYLLPCTVKETQLGGARAILMSTPCKYDSRCLARQTQRRTVMLID